MELNDIIRNWKNNFENEVNFDTGITQQDREKLVQLIKKDYIKKSSLPTVEEIEKKYYELILSVGNKYKNETRHQTALRYIKQAENESSSPSKAIHARVRGEGKTNEETGS